MNARNGAASSVASRGADAAAAAATTAAVGCAIGFAHPTVAARSDMPTSQHRQAIVSLMIMK
jgi:hypothetical protein